MKIATVLGGTGFIGSHIAQALETMGRRVRIPDRDSDLSGRELGTVFYCIGLTADFRERPLETVDAHVTRLHRVLEHCRFDRLIYLSSTRVYDSSDPADLYNLSKLTGESLALHCSPSTVVARLSNVYGPDFRSKNFLPSVINDALRNRRVVLRSDPQSAKDYVSIYDAVPLLIKIAESGRERMYNVASGTNVTHHEVLDRLQRATGCEVVVAGGPHTVFPPIDIEPARSEFGYSPRGLATEFERLIDIYRRDLALFDRNDLNFVGSA